MGTALRAVVIGAGWAGEGHTRALRFGGVEVAAICARRADVVQAVASRLEIPEASTDWQETLRRLRPDIVALATPAALRREVVEEAASLGCHLLCDKPLAATAAEAEALYRAAAAAGVKHAYAATHRYDPGLAWLAELVRGGRVGRVRDVTATFRLNLPPLVPWSWMLTLAAGGGVLNNGATHYFGMVERLLGGEVVAVAGQALAGPDRAPYVPEIHDFRDWLAQIGQLTPEAAAQLEWRPADADMAYSALLWVAGPDGEVPVVLVSGTGTHAPGEGNRWRIYGEQGTLAADGGLRIGAVTHAPVDGADPVPLPVPERLQATLPQLENDIVNKWAALAADFVADVRGEPHEPYLTFRDGWRYQVAIDAIRSGKGGHAVPGDLPHLTSASVGAAGTPPAGA